MVAPIYGNTSVVDAFKNTGAKPAESGYLSSTEDDNGVNSTDGYSSSKYLTNTTENQNESYDNLGAYADKQTEDAFRGFDKSELTEGMDNDDGFASFSQAKIEALFNKLRAAANLNLLIAQSLDTKEEMMDRIAEATSESEDEAPKSKTTYSEGVLKSNKVTMDNFQKGVMTLLKEVEAHNYKVFTAREQSHKSWREDSWDTFTNWITGGDEEEEEAEQMKDLNEQYKKAKQKNLDAIKNLGGLAAGINSKMTEIGDNIINNVIDAEQYIKYTEDNNGYIDINASSRWFSDMRRLLSGLANANRMTIASISSRQDSLDAMEEALSGKKAGSNKYEASKEVVESESSHMMMTFDQLQSTTLDVQKLQNQKRKWELELEKLDEGWLSKVFSRICTALSAICSAISFVVPVFAIAAAGLAIVAAGLAYLAAEQADAVHDSYTPSVDNSNTNAGPASNSLEGKIEALGVQAKGKLTKDVLDTNEDGMLSMDYAKITRMQKELNGINAALYLIQKNISQKGKMLQAIHRATSGLSGAGGQDDLFDAMAENILSQSGAEFGMLAFQLNQYQQGFNMEHQQYIAMRQASERFYVSLGTSVGSFVGSGVGGAVGQGIAMASTFGSALSEYLLSHYDSAYGMAEYNPEVSDFKGISKDTNASKGIGQKLDGLEAAIYSELTGDDMIVDIGDGKFGLNADKLASLQTKFMRLMNTVALLVSNNELKVELQNAIAQAYGYSAVTEPSSMGRVSDHFANSYRTFSYLKQLLNEKAQVKNRIAAAEERASVASTKLTVIGSVDAAAVAYSGYAYIAGGSTSTVFIQGVLMAANTVNSFFGQIYELVRSAIKTKNDFGKFQNYSERKSRKQEEKEAAKSISEALEQKEAELYLDGSLLEDVTSGTLGLNSGELSRVTKEGEGLYRTKQILSGAMRQMQNCKAIIERAYYNSVVSASSTAGLDMESYQSKVMVEGILQTQTEALQTIVSRHNQAQQAVTATAISAVKLSISIAQEVIKAIGNIRSLKLESLKAEQAASLKGEISSAKKTEMSLLEENIKMPPVGEFATSIVLSVLSSIIDFTVASIVDAEAKSASKGEKGKKVAEKKKALNKESKEAKTFAEKVQMMEEQSLADDRLAAQNELNMEDTDYRSQRAEQGSDSIKSLGESMPSAGKEIDDRINKKQMQTLISKLKETEKKIKEEEKAIKQTLSKAKADFQKALTEFKAEQQQGKTPNVSTLMARADAISAAAVKAQQFVENSDPTIKEIRKERESKVKVKTDPLENKKNPDIKEENPDKKVKTGEDIAKGVKEIKDLSEELKRVKDPRVMEQKANELLTKLESLDRSMASSSIHGELAEASLAPEGVDKIQESIDAEAEKINGKKVELKDLNPEDLQDLYNKLYAKIFKPASEELLGSVAERRKKLDQIKELSARIETMGADSTEAKDLHAQIATVQLEIEKIQKKEGEARNKIQGFNRLVGKINKEYRNKTGHDLQTVQNRPTAVQPPAAKKTIAPTWEQQAKEAEHAQSILLGSQRRSFEA